MAFTMSRKINFLILWSDRNAVDQPNEQRDLGHQLIHLRSDEECESSVVYETMKRQLQSIVIVFCEPIISETMVATLDKSIVSAFFILSSNAELHNAAYHSKCQGIFNNRADLIDAVQNLPVSQQTSLVS